MGTQEIDALQRRVEELEAALRAVRSADARLQAALDDERGRIATILDAVSDAVITLDLDGRLVHLNEAGARLLGCDAAESLGAPVGEVVHIERAGEVVHLEALSAAVVTAGGDLEVTDTDELVSLRGARVAVDYRIARLRSASGESVGSVLSVRDVTARRRQDDERRQLVNDLADANGELERFTAIVAHDLRGPMAVIAGMASLLGTRFDDLEPPVAQEFLERIQARAMQAAVLVEDLLGYAREGGNGDRRPVDLRALAQAVFADLTEEVASVGAKLTHGELPTVFGNWTALRQVLVNLVTNSLRYRHPDRRPVVHVDAVRRGSRWEVRVADNGVGIAPEQRERVFQLGVHTDTDADGRRGTGVGLASSRLVITRLGGRIWVDPDHDGPGTCVAFELAPALVHTPAGRPRSVLIVDDEVGGLDPVIEALERAQVVVVGVASTAEEAIAALDDLEEHPGAVLIDLRLGDNDGIELLGRLHHDHPALPLVLHSAHIDGTTTARAADAGAAGCIEKTTPDELVEALVALWLGHPSPSGAQRLLDAAAELPPVAVFAERPADAPPAEH